MKRYLYKKKLLSIPELAALPECSCSKETLRNRIKITKWSVSKAVNYKSTRKSHKNRAANDSEALEGTTKTQKKELKKFEKICDRDFSSNVDFESIMISTVKSQTTRQTEISSYPDLPIVEME